MAFYLLRIEITHFKSLDVIGTRRYSTKLGRNFAQNKNSISGIKSTGKNQDQPIKRKQTLLAGVGLEKLCLRESSATLMFEDFFLWPPKTSHDSSLFMFATQTKEITQDYYKPLVVVNLGITQLKREICEERNNIQLKREICEERNNIASLHY
jgi:hypothetical protein